MIHRPRSRRLRRLGVALAPLVCIASCRESSIGGAPSLPATLSRPASAPPLGARVCDVLVRQPVQRRAACCQTAAAAPFDACVSALDRALVSGRLRVDEGALARCQEATMRERDGCAWVTPSSPLPPAACDGLFVGAVPSGGACHSSLECAAPLHCAGATPAQAGTCAEPLPVGAECARTSDALASYTLSVNVEREHPLCDGSCSFGAGKCQASRAASAASPKPRVAAGEACRSDFDCATGGCDASGHCGMKCSVSFDPIAASTPALVMRRTPAASVD
jgi:hypothetical protein